MKVVLQRCIKGVVEIDNKVFGKCNNGFVALVGFTKGDNEIIVDKMIQKIIYLRVFEDENMKMNKSLLDINGEILSVSQFTLYANAKEGRRPSFTEALNKVEATKLYDYFNKELAKFVKVETGSFGADMKVQLINDGPVTIILDSKELF